MLATTVTEPIRGVLLLVASSITNFIFKRFLKHVPRGIKLTFYQKGRTSQKLKLSAFWRLPKKR
jgi:hypothetical protein